MNAPNLTQNSLIKGGWWGCKVGSSNERSCLVNMRVRSIGSAVASCGLNETSSRRQKLQQRHLTLTNKPLNVSLMRRFVDLSVRSMCVLQKDRKFKLKYEIKEKQRPKRRLF